MENFTEREKNFEGPQNPPHLPEFLNIAAKEGQEDSHSLKTLLNSGSPVLIQNSGGNQVKGRKCEYKHAANPEKVRQAKQILMQNNHQLKYLLELSDFKGYNKTSDFRRYLKKYLHNNKQKKFKQSSHTESSHSNSQLESQIEKEDEKSEEELQQSLPSTKLTHLIIGPTIQIDQGAIVGMEKLAGMIQKFKSSNYQEKSQILQELSSRNTQSLYQFVEQFQNTLDSSATHGLFSLLLDLIQNYNRQEQDTRSRILLTAFAFYRGELVAVEENLIRDCCIILTQKPNLLQAIGLANYVFVNDAVTFAKQEDVIKKLDKLHSNIIQLMKETFNIFEIDFQIIRLLPSSLHVLNAPFIAVLKQDCGLGLLREIPPIYTPYFIKICALCSSPTVEELTEYMAITRITFLQKQEQLDQNSLLCFMRGLSERLEAREAQWIGKVEQIKRLQSQIIDAYIEKGVRLSDEIIKNCLSGDCSELQRILQLPKAMEAFSEEITSQMIKLFEEANRDHPVASSFINQSNEEKLSLTDDVEKLQQVLGFKLYSSQILCVNYILRNLKHNHLIHFGIGNGKTLICMALAILLASSQCHSVFLISKNEHLVQRDFIKFQRVIKTLGLNANLNGFARATGIYFYTLPQLRKQMINQKLVNVWAQSVVIVDEYDWILLDGSENTVVNMLKFFKQALTVIGFSGSTPSLTEQNCLKLALNTSPVVFCSLDRLKGDKKMQRADVLVVTNQSSYIQKMKDIVLEQIKYSPVLIVAQDMYRVIDAGLSSCSLDFYSLSRNSASVIESVIEGRYLMKNSKKEYGVYLLNEAHGRGTDIQTNDEINNNGGSYLIIADVFSRRSEEQIIGRIGRLNTKGQWQRVIFRGGAKDSIEQLLFVEQNSIDLQLNNKYCKIQQKLEEMNEQKSESEVEKSSEEKMSTKENENKVEKILQENDEKEKQEDKKKSEENPEDLLKSQKKSSTEEDLKKGDEENVKEETSKLGFYQPTIIECIEQQLSQNPVLSKVPFTEVQERVRRAMKRSENQISRTPNRSRSSSRSSKRTNKRGRPRTRIDDYSDDDDCGE